MTALPNISEVQKTGALLAAVILHNLIYPISQNGFLGAVVFYVFYGGMFIAATWTLTASHVMRRAALVTGAAVFAAGVAHAATGAAVTALAVFISSIAYHGVIIVVLGWYTLAARNVFTEVILAATTLYLIIGSGFAAVFALIEWLVPGSFVGAAGPVSNWQELLYFSYVTLTSLGFGDILPVSYYAQAFTAFEAIAGVLYTVILLSRLVGMHTAKRVS
ncbi:MAG: ion channel [Rhodobacteraceae bacterium]|nr:ion channel [Paracoccaceae bacterium]